MKDRTADPFPCSKCPLSFGMKHHLKRHLQAHALKHTCTTCGKVCKSLDQLTRHQRVTHLGLKEWACSLCPKAYGKKIDLQSHQLRVHGESLGIPSSPPAPTRFACGYTDCGQAFPRFAQLQEHITLAHPLVCPHCDRSFTRRDVLTDHITTHQSPETRPLFPCPSCPKSYFQKKNLIAHIRASHAPVRPFVCLFCGEAFGYKHVRDRHVELMHARVSIPNETSLYVNQSIPGSDNFESCQRGVLACKAEKVEEDETNDDMGDYKARSEFGKPSQRTECQSIIHLSPLKEAFLIQTAFEQASIARIKPLPQPKRVLGFAERFDGCAAHMSDPKRHIPCTHEGCRYRFIRDYDLQRHLHAYH